MPLSPDALESALRAAFPGAAIELRDLAGDGDHYQVTVTSGAFRGLTRVKQHKLVYDALEGGMGTTLHALSVITKIPE